MTTYNTGNAIGSTDARDLYDNAQNLDHLVNSTSATYSDRKGVTRCTLAGIQSGVKDVFSDVDASVSKKMTDVDSVLASKITELDSIISSQFNLSAATAWSYKIGATPGTSEGQTTFSGLDLAEGNVEVFYNGIRLYSPDDYSYTHGTLTLAAPCVSGDIVAINNFRYPVTVIDGGYYA